MKRGDRVTVGLCHYAESPSEWASGTVVAAVGPVVAVVLDNGQDWIGCNCYVKTSAR